MKKPVKISLWGVGTLFVAIPLLINIVVPIIARSYVNSHGKELIGRDIYIDDISLNLYTGVVEVDSFNLYEPDGKTPFVQFRHLDINLGLMSLLTGNIYLEAINLDKLEANIEQNVDQFNFSDILAFLDSGEKEPEVEEESGSTSIVIDSLKVSNTAIRYQDLHLGSDLTLNEIALRIPHIDLNDLNPHIDLAFSMVDGGDFKINLDYNDVKQDIDLNLIMKRLNLHTVYPYLKESVACNDIQGNLNADIKVKGNLEHILGMQVQGKTQVSDFKLIDPKGEACIAADTLSLATSEVNLLKNRFGFSHIRLVRPDIHIEIGADSLDNISRMLTTAPIDAQETPVESEEPAVADSLIAVLDSTTRITEDPFDLYIDRLQVLNGKARYTDLTMVYEPFDYQVDNINFDAPDFQLNGVNDLAISCMPGSGDGSISIKYHGSLEDTHNMKVDLTAQDIALKDFSPFTVQMFGNPMSSGLLSFDSNTDVKNGDLDSYNHLIIKQPKVENKRKDVKPEINAPFKAGLYILTDKNGVCDMELPITGNIDEPKFSVRRLIFKTLGKLIVKVAATPLGNVESVTAAPATETAVPATETAAPSETTEEPAQETTPAEENKESVQESVQEPVQEIKEE